MNSQQTLQQLGGSQFVVMTGAHTFVASRDSLTFRIPKAKDGINAVRITLDANDTYTVEFMKIRNLTVTIVYKTTDIYCDQLAEVFEQNTGLYTSLKARRG